MVSKKKKAVFWAVIAFIAIIFIVLGASSRKKPVVEAPKERILQTVSVQTAAESVKYAWTAQYTADVVGDRETNIVAKTSGTVIVDGPALGTYASAGAVLVRLDDTGNIASAGYGNFRSLQVQQASLAVDQAKEAVNVARNNYKNIRSLRDEQDDSSGTNITKHQESAAKDQVDIAEIQLKDAQIALASIVDAHSITSSVGGYVIQKNISAGEFVSAGQTLMTLSQTKKVKVRFYVDQEQVALVKPGYALIAKDGSGSEHDLTVRNVAPQADPDTKRFLVEAYPNEKEDAGGLIAGTVADVTLSFERTTSVPGGMLLPISTIRFGQNENSVFVVEEGRAKSVPVDIRRIQGEVAEVITSLPADAQIVVEGNKLLQDGDAVAVI